MLVQVVRGMRCYLDVANVRSVADVGSQDVVEQLVVRTALLEDAEVGKCPRDVQPDELQCLLPAQPRLSGLHLVRGPGDEDLVELRGEV